MILLGVGTALAAHLEEVASVNVASVNKDETKVKIPKNMSMLQVETDEPMVVYVDGVEVGRTQGNKIKFHHPVTPGLHEVKIVSLTSETAPFVRTYDFRKHASNCVCLKTVREKIETPCPYDIRVSGPGRVQDGDLITFVATNAAPVASAAALNYVWKVSPGNARITSGLGTSTITVDATNLGNQTVTAEVEATNGFYDEQCRQRIPVNTFVEPPPVIEVPPPTIFDSLVFRVFDDDKARLDNYANALQNRPDSQGYIIMYQGPKVGRKTVEADRMAKRSLDYLVKVRGVDPRRLVITNGGNREATMGDLWIVPPGAQPPVATPR